jgi:hypothetical protein
MHGPEQSVQAQGVTGNAQLQEPGNPDDDGVQVTHTHAAFLLIPAAISTATAVLVYGYGDMDAMRLGFNG